MAFLDELWTIQHVSNGDKKSSFTNFQAQTDPIELEIGIEAFISYQSIKGLHLFV